jgi:hypothetical protein
MIVAPLLTTDAHLRMTDATMTTTCLRAASARHITDTMTNRDTSARDKATANGHRIMMTASIT